MEQEVACLLKVAENTHVLLTGRREWQERAGGDRMRQEVEGLGLGRHAAVGRCYETGKAEEAGVVNA